MDPTTDLPPMTSHAADHFPVLSPPVTATTTQTHPPYAEMITAAITALKDKDGSSRQAISKYIEKEFPNLPPTHSTLLTHHLKRLKNLGQLVMVKHSYMLAPPRSTLFQQPNYLQPVLHFNNNNNNIGSSDANIAAVGFNLENSGSGSVKRRPGRPPKLKPVPALAVHNQMGEADIVSYQPQPQFRYNADIGSEPLFASLGLGDDGVVVAPVAPPPPFPPASENTPVVVKRGRGRPPKSAGGSGVGGGELQVVEEGLGLGRPGRKGNGVRVKKGRGRPKRIGFGAVTVPLSGNLLRPKGRPKRVVRPKNMAVNGGAVGESVLGSRRRGRPSRNMIGDLLGKPLGSISKKGPGTAVLVTDPHQLVVYQELKNKYEHLQSKVKQVASMVKSCIDPDYGNTALGALQELEDLAAEVNARSNP